jgi:hypothetical protein
LIYAAIIALWAAVLIPIWLKRHDQVSEVRSTARFSSAMKSLGSRENSKNRNENHGGTSMPRSQASAIAAKRRAMVLAFLTGLLFISLVGTLFAAVPIAITIVFAVLLGAFVLASALTASGRSQTSVSPRLEQHDDIEIDIEVEASAPRARMTSRDRAVSQKSELDAFAEWDPWEDEDNSWDAVPQTLPSYVSSPRATAVPRNIERDGDWSGEAMVEAARGMRRPAMRAEHLVRNPVANAAEDTTEIPIIRANAPYQARAVNE